MTIRRYTTALAAAAVGAVAVAGAVGLTASPAGAANGSPLPAGSTVCTDWTRSDVGARILGFAFGAPGTWSVRASNSVGGPETEIFRTTALDVDRIVAPAGPGTFFFRNCLTVSQDALGYRLNLSKPKLGTFEPGIGPHTAVLAPGGRACGEFAGGGTARLVGSASVPVAFTVGGFDSDYAQVSEAWRTSGRSVNQVVTLPLQALDACAVNTSDTTAFVAFELRPA